jgi:selenocysteine lyase/cysteine desulfurase
MAIAAANIPVRAGSSIVLLAQDFPSNVFTWREAARRNKAEIVTVERDPEAGWTEAILRAVSNRTAVVVTPLCHWVDGTVVDLVRVGQRAREVGAALVIDASQALGATPIDLGSIQPDFLVSVGYKWQLGPYGLGYLYASPKWQQKGIPIEQSWMPRRGSSDFTRLTDYSDAFQPGARRFDMGEFTQFIAAPMCAAGLQQILDWGIPSIEQSISQLTDYIADRALAAGYLVAPAEQRAKHMLGIRFRGGQPAKLPAPLAQATSTSAAWHLSLGVLIRPNRACHRGLPGLRLAFKLQFLLPQLAAPCSIFVVLLLFLGLRLQSRHRYSPTLAVHSDKGQIGRSHMPVHSCNRVLHPHLHSHFHRGVESAIH